MHLFIQLYIINTLLGCCSFSCREFDSPDARLLSVCPAVSMKWVLSASGGVQAAACSLTSWVTETHSFWTIGQRYLEVASSAFWVPVCTSICWGDFCTIDCSTQHVPETSALMIAALISTTEKWKRPVSIGWWLNKRKVLHTHKGTALH